MPDSSSMTFEADPLALASVRRFACEQASTLGARVDIDLLAVIVGELAANATIHQDRPARLELAVRPNGAFEVAVWDSSPDQPRLIKEDAWSTEGHRGMQLIDALTAAWGVEHTTDGKRVWAVLEPVPAPA